MNYHECQIISIWIDYHFERNPAKKLKEYFDYIILICDDVDDLIIENALLHQDENVFFVRELIETMAEKELIQNYDMYDSIKLYINCKIKAIESGQIKVGSFLKEINTFNEEKFYDQKLSNIINEISSLYWDYSDVEDVGQSFTIENMNMENRDYVCLSLIKKYAANTAPPSTG